MDDYGCAILATVNDSVSQGALWLDRSCPGWEECFARRLDVGRWDACVLGQLATRYAAAAKALEYSAEWLINHGFLRASMLVCYCDLSAAWEALIYARGTRRGVTLRPPPLIPLSPWRSAANLPANHIEALRSAPGGNGHPG